MEDQESYKNPQVPPFSLRSPLLGATEVHLFQCHRSSKTIEIALYESVFLEAVTMIIRFPHNEDGWPLMIKCFIFITLHL